MRNRYWLAALALFAGAAIQRLWIAPLLERLPADYADETRFAAKARYRDSPNASWGTSELIARRVDQALMATADRAIVQGDMHWTDAAGAVQFESSHVYGVDRHTRANLPRSGDAVRHGAFLFPLHTQPKSYPYWDPMYDGPRTARFGGTATIDGLEVYVFPFTAAGLVESTGYAHLPTVPERYEAHTDGRGTMWIEPTSGVIVDYHEQGASYFVEPASGKRVADFYLWEDRYTPETKVAKLREAAVARQRVHLLERWLPLALTLAGVGCFALGWRRRARPVRGRQIEKQAESVQ